SANTHTHTHTHIDTHTHTQSHTHTQAHTITRTHHPVTVSRSSGYGGTAERGNLQRNNTALLAFLPPSHLAVIEIIPRLQVKDELSPPLSSPHLSSPLLCSPLFYSLLLS